MTDSTYDFIATCAMGIENLLQKEIITYGGLSADISPGAVIFKGNLDAAYRMLVWSRFASRILFHIAEIEDTKNIYDLARNISWKDYFSYKSTFAIQTASSGTTEENSHFLALRIKDAIVDYFRDTVGSRPDISVQMPDFPLHLHIGKTKASLRIDMSGRSLHRRGYRDSLGDAPLKETLAAAILRISGWPPQDKNIVFIDPMCGSGTFAIEAAFMYGNIAPGILRDYFGVKGWLGHNPKLWSTLLEEAEDIRNKSLSEKWPCIIGYDSSRKAIGNATMALEKSGLKKKVHFERKDLGSFVPPSADSGFIVMNPPYGERLGDKDSLPYLYDAIGNIINKKCPDWHIGIFCSSYDLIEKADFIIEKKHALYNGPLKCTLAIGRCKSKVLSPVIVLPSLKSNTSFENNSDFGNRLIKNLKNLKEMIIKEETSCYRLYNRDLPDYNMVIDVYDKDIHIQEYEAPIDIKPEVAELRRLHVIETVQKLFDINKKNIFFKLRKRQKGKSSQYQKLDNAGILKIVNEGSCRFLVNLSEYIDTGIFFDHRLTRKYIREQSEGRRFLNLFSYTASATIHAIYGKAKKTVSVDNSPTYIKWAEMNFNLNGFSTETNYLVSEDCIHWLKKSTDMFEIIFIDPPTFSNSQKTGTPFSVQKHHPELINLAMARLTADGILIFSNNFKKFRLDESINENFKVKDISLKMMSPDCKRNIFHCWEIKHIN